LDLRARLRRLNPGASVIAASHGAADPGVVLGAGLFDLAGKAPDLRAWVNADAFAAADRAGHPLESSAHDTRLDAFCLTFARPLLWAKVATWLERLILLHGEALLRMKGILHLIGQARPVAIHGIGHLLHPPIPLAAWPDGDPRTSRLTFITRELPRDEIVEGLHAFNEAAGS
jgi:G3E family GTPase